MAFVAFQNIVHTNMYKVYNYMCMCISYTQIYDMYISKIYTNIRNIHIVYLFIQMQKHVFSYISRDLHGSNKLFKASLMASFSFLIAFSQLITSVELVFRLLTYKLGFYEFCNALQKASIFYRGY